MIRAVWNGVVLAETPRTVRVEGNHYFPPESVRQRYVIDSTTKSLCPWKGVARYCALTVGDEVLPDAAWYYPKPTPLARRIKGHVAFDYVVRIEGEPETTARAATTRERDRGGLLSRLSGLLGGGR